MYIKKFKKYLEAISGTMDTMPFGPGSPRPVSPNTITSNDTNVIFSEITDKIYTEDDYNDLYFDYLKRGGKPLSGFTLDNLNLILVL